MKRRSFLLLLPGSGVPGAVLGAAPAYPPVDAGRTLAFPRDHGAHPDYRTEWWYATGWLQTQARAPLGFQVTFFRSRPQFDQANPSLFAPLQLLFANVALSDPVAGKLQHDQRAVRSGFGLAFADTADTNVFIDNWSLRREMTGRYREISRAGFHPRFDNGANPTVVVAGRTGLQPQGPSGGPGELLLQPAWAQGERHFEVGRPAGSCARHRLAGS